MLYDDLTKVLENDVGFRSGKAANGKQLCRQVSGHESAWVMCSGRKIAKEIRLLSESVRPRSNAAEPSESGTEIELSNPSIK